MQLMKQALYIQATMARLIIEIGRGQMLPRQGSASPEAVNDFLYLILMMVTFKTTKKKGSMIEGGNHTGGSCGAGAGK